MTTIQQAIFNALAGYSGVSGLVGTRVYPDEAKQGVVKPYIVWEELSDNEENDLSGSAETGGKHNYRIQVTCWDVDQTKARELNKQIKLAMSAASGFKSLHLDTRSLGKNVDSKVYGMQSDFSVWITT